MFIIIDVKANLNSEHWKQKGLKVYRKKEEEEFLLTLLGIESSVSLASSLLSSCTPVSISNARLFVYPVPVCHPGP